MGPLELPEPQTMTLPNGVDLTWLDNGEMEVNRLTVLTDGGQMHTPGGEVPLASLCAKLARRGTLGRGDREIADALETAGSWLAATASVNHTSLTVHSLNSTMGRVLPVVRDIVAEPSFEPGVTATVLDNEARKLETELCKVDVLADRALSSLLYGEGHPLAGAPTPEGIRSATPGQLAAFHRQAMNPAHVHVYLAGRVNDALLDDVCAMALSLPDTGPGYEPVSPTIDAGGVSGRKAQVKRPGALQSAVRVALPAIGREHPDYVALHLAVRALGGYFGSRLMLNVREDKGLTYGINASLLGHAKFATLVVATQTANRHRGRVIEEVAAEMERMKDPGTYTPQEIARLRGYVLTTLAQSLDTPFTIMDQYVTRRLVGTPPGYFGQMDAAARALTAEDLAATARRHFDTSRLLTVVAGDD